MPQADIKWALSAYYRFITSQPGGTAASTLQGSWKKYEPATIETVDMIHVVLTPSDTLSVMDRARVFETHNLIDPAIRLKENEDAPDTVIAYHKCKTGVRVSGYEFKSGGIKDQFLQAMRSYRVLAGAESNSSSAPNENTSQLNESDSGLQESDATFSQYDSLENRPHKLVRRQNNTWSQISTLPETQDVTSTLAETQEVSQSSTLFLTNNTVDDTPNKPEAKRPPDSPPPELTRLLKKRKTELGIPVEVDISVFLRLCLLDPTFPEFVEKIEQELCDVLKAD